MTIAIKHAFASAKGDGTDATLIQPSAWNAAHSTSMASGNLLGRLSASTGVFEEIPISSLVAAALNSPDGATFLTALGVSGFSTGDGKITFKNTADIGWVMMNDGTIGDASSNSSTRANLDTQPLFTLLYNNLSDTLAPVYSSLGILSNRATFGTAATAYAAHVQLALPRQLGRAIISAGNGAGLSPQALANYGGENNHALTVAELAAHGHNVFLNDPGHTHNIPVGGYSPTTANYLAITTNTVTTTLIGATAGGITNATTGITINNGVGGSNQTATNGSGTAHNIMQPFTAWNVEIKL